MEAKDKLEPRHDAPTNRSGFQYTSWGQVAGYFDGDGSVSIFIWKFVVAFYLDFADQYEEQLKQIVTFIRGKGIRTGVVRKMTNSAAYALRIGDQDSVVRIAERIAPFCVKKRAELETLLEYRKLDLITGSEVQARFKHYVETGMRERHGNRILRPLPWSFSVGYRRSRMGRRGHPRKRWPVLSEAQKEQAREKHNVLGESITMLSSFYGVSRSAIWRILKK